MDKKNTPEVKLGQYKGLAVTRHVRPVTDKTVDIELVHQARMHAVYHPTTAPATRGFRALLDFAGYMDGKEIPDSRMEKVMVVLGDGKLMPAAEQAIYRTVRDRTPLSGRESHARTGRGFRQESGLRLPRCAEG